MRTISPSGRSRRCDAKSAQAAVAVVVIALAPLATRADEPIGRIKTQSGTVNFIQAAKTRPAVIGGPVFRSDTIVTGGHSSVGVAFADNSLMALGPFSRLSLDQFRFNTTTHDGEFDVSLRRGTLAIKSGQIVKQTPEAMRVRTPVAVLGVRGTEFVVRADGGKNR
jgi:hypothetical protein